LVYTLLNLNYRISSTIYKNKRMKKLFVFVICAGLITNSMGQVKRDVNPAQSSHSKSSKKREKKEMMKELNLSKEQRAQIKELNRSIKEKKGAIKSDQSMPEDQKQSKLKELHKEKQEKMDKILTPEQRIKLGDLKKNRKVNPAGSNTALPPSKKPGK
jgi:Spy/CpxP family protein refolding chaperone